MENNNINHPNYYNREGAIECIEEMILVFGRDKVANFCLCNAWKYRYRAADKNGIEDLKKSDWYMKKYQELTQSCINTISLGSEVCIPTYPTESIYAKYDLDKEE